MRKLAVCALLVFTTAFSFSQQLSPERAQQLRALNERYQQAYQAKNYTGALAAIEQTAAEFRDNKDVQAALDYNSACMHALLGHKQKAIELIRAAFAGGYTDYASFVRDTDFDSLRNDAEFKAVTAELHDKYRAKPLVFDSNEKAPDFSLNFEDSKIAEYAQLRSEFKIDDVVAGSRDDYERLQRLTLWTSKQWKHDSFHMASKSDPLTILREARQGGRFICMNYAVVLVGAARSYGLRARLLGLAPKEVETRSEMHSVVEVWVPQFNKWVIADAQWGIVPEVAGKPVSAVELQSALASEDKRVVCKGGAESCAEWQPFILRNMYYFKIANQQRFYSTAGTAFAQLVLVPKGAPNPHKFAGGNEAVFANSTYTSNPDVFYAPPRP